MFRPLTWVALACLVPACVGASAASVADASGDSASADVSSAKDAGADAAIVADVASSSDTGAAQDTVQAGDIAVGDQTAPPLDGPADASKPTDVTVQVDAVGTADIAASDATVPTDGGSPSPISCAGPAYYFPAFDKSCMVNTDCFVAKHTVNCCGTMIALGYSTKDQAAFEAAEKICDNQYPGCGCASMATQAEDGYSDLGTGIVANCVAGQCTTSVPNSKMVCTSSGLTAPQPFKYCSSTAECDSVERLVDCCGSKMVVGITKATKANFAGLESKCTAGMPVCDCLSKPTVAEDGGVVGDAPPVVKCSYGACVTAAK